MAKPIVAIVGRPNVGKSTLFNSIAGERISIVSDTPGVTRDRIYSDVEWLDRKFVLIDTGGIEPKTSDALLKAMRDQAELAVEMADVIIFLTNVKEGVTDSDSDVANMLRRSKKPVVLVVNKVDSFVKSQNDVYEFYNLGIGDPIPISAANMSGLGDMLDKVISYFPEDSGDDEEDDTPKIAIIGKPNVGKSSLVNRLSGQNRVIVSNMAGTTRDAVDTIVTYEGRKYILIDTAGLRKKSKVKEDLEYYSVVRAVSAVEKADVIFLMIDAETGVTEQDAKIAGIAHENGKGVLILVNKWDLIKKDTNTSREFEKKIRNTLSFMPYADILFISVESGQRVTKLFDRADEIMAAQNMRIQTGVLNDILAEAMVMQQPPSDKGRVLKIYYMTEVAVKPPTFVLFVNSKKLMHFSYVRYIENKLRETFGFRGTPIRFIIRERNEDK